MCDICRCFPFDKDEKTENWPFCKLVGVLIMWLAISTRRDVSNAVRSVASYCSVPKVIHRKAALGILAYINGSSSFSTTNQRGTTPSPEGRSRVLKR